MVEQQNLENVDAVLSGHLHGGQINIFGLERFWTPSNYGLKYKSGIIFKDDIEAIVTKGLGGSTFPMRLGAKPDIIKLVLSSK